MKKVNFYRRRQFLTNLLQDETQTSNQCPFCNTNLIELILVALFGAEPDRAACTETQKGLIAILCRQIEDVNSLARALDSTTPMPLRKYQTKLVDSLIYQTQTLTGILSDYVIPRLEQIDNNKK